MNITLHHVASGLKSEDICGEAEIKLESTDNFISKIPKRKKHEIEIARVWKVNRLTYEIIYI